MTTIYTPFRTNKQHWLYLLFLALILFFASGCKKNDQGGDTDTGQQNPPTDPLKPTASVSTTVRGLVLDEEGHPVPGAAISIASYSATTSDAGAFELTNISVPGNRCVIVCEKEGYFKSIRAEEPLKDGTTETHLVLMNSNPTHTINASSGGKATLSNGSEVQLPANGIVDASGTAYTGVVNVSLRYLDPTAAGFGTVVPGGDMLAQRTDQSTSILYSYGILRVQLTGLSGDALQLGEGKTATVVMDIPEKQSATAPASIPLWYFDEEKGVWKEEG
ncbi:MAG TPA: carboxypeptidase-like regulatory domain-containing protein, partial [Niastella sp.]|nr:carboxypeptidase-like regulatory domain-containing protein [Niastella sp.]